MKTLKCLALAAALAVAAGCSDDETATTLPTVTVDGGADAAVGTDAATPDGGTPDVGTVGPDGGAPDVVATITLVEWVTDLVTNQTMVPDTVDDKHVIDTMDPAAFDPLLGK